MWSSFSIPAIFPNHDLRSPELEAAAYDDKRLEYDRHPLSRDSEDFNSLAIHHEAGCSGGWV
jgi:hypothetical protein